MTHLNIEDFGDMSCEKILNALYQKSEMNLLSLNLTNNIGRFELDISNDTLQILLELIGKQHFLQELNLNTGVFS